MLGIVRELNNCKAITVCVCWASLQSWKLTLCSISFLLDIIAIPRMMTLEIDVRKTLMHHVFFLLSNSQTSVIAAK